MTKIKILNFIKIGIFLIQIICRLRAVKRGSYLEKILIMSKKEENIVGKEGQE
jgi:hypothetical protein